MATDKPTISLMGNTPTTTSLALSQHFGKLHKNILRDIESLECSAEFSELNFEPAEYIDAQKKPRPMYRITRDGFVFLAMGFTGKQAAEWKEKYIAAFNLMEQTLRGQYLTTKPRAKRPKVNRTTEREIMQLFVAGMSNGQIRKELGVSTSTISQILSAKWQFADNAGEPECTPELLEAVVQEHLKREQNKIQDQHQRLVNKLSHSQHNSDLAGKLDRLSKHLSKQTAAEALNAPVMDDNTKGVRHD